MHPTRVHNNTVRHVVSCRVSCVIHHTITHVYAYSAGHTCRARVDNVLATRHVLSSTRVHDIVLLRGVHVAQL